MKRNKQKHIIAYLLKRIKKYRLFMWIVSLSCLFILVFIQKFLFINIAIIGGIGLITLVITGIIYNWIIFKLWRCPSCNAQLPIKHNSRWGINPKIAKNCSNCKQQLIK